AKDGARAGEVIDRIRALLKRRPPRKDDVDLNRAILDVIALTHDQALRHHVALETRLSEDLPLVHADKVQLQQVLLNLIVNAIQAMSQVADRHRSLTIVSLS